MMKMNARRSTPFPAALAVALSTVAIASVEPPNSSSSAALADDSSSKLNDGPAHRLRLFGRPRHVRVGVQRTFTFHVATTARRPVANARVAFAGERVRTGRNGAAEIEAKLNRPGKRVARATKPGYREAELTIKVRRRGGRPDEGKAESFEGSCEFEGTAHFDPPMGLSSKPTTVVADAPGRCTGTLTDATGRTKRLEQAPVLFHEQSRGDQSCLSNPASTGTGHLAFEGARIDFIFNETRMGPDGEWELEGQSGGSFLGTFSASDDPGATLSACAAGNLAQSDFTASGSTEPAISG
jgi:hypothetical protein